MLREWQPTPVFFPGKPHEQRRLAGYSPWGHRFRHNQVTNTMFSATMKGIAETNTFQVRNKSILECKGRRTNVNRYLLIEIQF